MYPEVLSRSALWLFVSLLGVGLLACDDEINEEDTDEVLSVPVVPSAKSRLKFKGGQRYVTDLSRGLDLPRKEICLELGEYDCVAVVHRIVLGGVEPYTLGIHEPLEIAPVTAPIAIDRVALSACDLRAEKDFDDPSSATVFGEVATSGSRPASVKQREAVVRRLYERLQSRRAEKREVDAIVTFQEEVRQEVDEADVNRQWAVMSCFVVATSTQALFY